MSGAPNRPELTQNLQAILKSPSYRLPEKDLEFLAGPGLRPVRMQLELLKPETLLAEHHIRSTIVLFGGTQIIAESEARQRLELARTAAAAAPDDAILQRRAERAEKLLAKAPYYEAAREFARLATMACQPDDRIHYVIVTGGGPGIMEAGNRGAYEAGGKSIGLNIALPAEQVPNPYITPELCFQFHYFAMRKFHFLLRARALIAFPGGFGTLDELFGALTLRQTHRMQEIPIVLFGRAYWDRVVDFQFLADEGVIHDEHLNLISYAEDPREAWEIITRFHQGPGGADPRAEPPTLSQF
jgi:hypothetical protein